ncbi:MAG: DNA recombination protein RmuC [Aeromonadaceae bacterium]
MTPSLSVTPLLLLGGLLFLGLLLAWWRGHQRVALLELQLQQSRGEVDALQAQGGELQQQHRTLLELKAAVEVQVGRLDQECISLEQQLQQKQEELERLERTLTQHNASQLGERDRRLIQLEQELAAERQRHQQTAQQLIVREREYAELSTSQVEKQRHFAAQLQQLAESREMLKTEFEQLANEILERKGQAFKALNQESVSQLLRPVQQEMQGFRQKVESIHVEELKQRSELKNELENLQKLNRTITEQAERLTTALQGQKKTQGNWGELMLENVLDGSGLRLGQDYRREVSFNTEEGRLRPDVVVSLPQGKQLIIDAKTSLAAYTRYVNAEEELERQQALVEHSQAVGARIRELAEREYHKLPGLNSPEVVIMFIPIESAYVAALRHDPALYQRAIERNVLVATPTTLLTSLNIVRQLWRFEDQSKHTAELASRAERFYNKLHAFLVSMQEVGKQLERAKGSYDKALAQLYSGRGNLIKQAAEFKELGVAVQKELPGELVERAELELGEGLNLEWSQQSGSQEGAL